MVQWSIQYNLLIISSCSVTAYVTRSKKSTVDQSADRTRADYTPVHKVCQTPAANRRCGTLLPRHWMEAYALIAVDHSVACTAHATWPSTTAICHSDSRVRSARTTQYTTQYSHKVSLSQCGSRGVHNSQHMILLHPSRSTADSPNGP